jgi:hypothetical protein
VGDSAVGETLPADGVLTIAGAGVAVGAALHAITIVPNPIATPHPRILKSINRMVFLPGWHVSSPL